ncbi:MAG TPA: YitT family protein [Pyrinomonadaceae bacterium]
MLKKIAQGLIRAGFLILGIFSAAFGLKGFLLSSHFIDGGVTGISMLLSNVLGWQLAILIPIINLPFIALAYKQIGRNFALRSVAAIGGLSLCLAFVKFPDVTPDRLLTAVFGGFFIGAGIGLAIRGGAVLDGTEIAALIISKSSHLLKVGDVILLLNVVIFLSAAFFLGIETALYSMLTYFAASKTIDFLIHGVEEHTAIIIMSEKNDEIRHAIVRCLKRGVTVFKGKGGLTYDDQDILFCVVTRLEIGRVKSVVDEYDRNAFVIIHGLADAEGGVVKRHVHS